MECPSTFLYLVDLMVDWRVDFMIIWRVDLEGRFGG
jgi:hypothetical protein